MLALLLLPVAGVVAASFPNATVGAALGLLAARGAHWLRALAARRPRRARVGGDVNDGIETPAVGSAD